MATVPSGVSPPSRGNAALYRIGAILSESPQPSELRALNRHQSPFVSCGLAKGSARSYSTEITLPRLAAGQTMANFTLGLMHKDVRLATELGVSSGTPMMISNLVREIFQTSLSDLGPDADVNQLIRQFERNGKVKVVG